MKRRGWIKTGITLLGGPVLCFSEEATPAIRIQLDSANPGTSKGRLLTGEPHEFTVGLGRRGIKTVGEVFTAGYSLLGRFRVNAILTKTRFEMTDALIQSSGKSREWLTQNLFANMSSIDFDGDGTSAEYGEGFIGLEPLDSNAQQPFHFGEYKGVLRWYSYAIHGTQDETRVGKCVTGGCLNVRKSDLEVLLKSIDLGDQVEIVES